MKYNFRRLEANIENKEDSEDNKISKENSNEEVGDVDVEEDEKITKRDLLKHLQQLNELIATQNEQFKEEITKLTNTFESLLSLHNKFEELYEFTHDAIKRNSGNILINSEEIANLTKLFGGKNGNNKFATIPMHDKIITRLSIIENNCLEKEKDNAENKDFVISKINNTNAKLEGFPEDIKTLQNELYYLKARVQELEVKKSRLADEENNSVVQHENSEKQKIEKNIDCDGLLLFDSNGQHLNADKLLREGKSQYEKVIKISDTIEKIEESSIKRAPQKILLNVGLNDIGSTESSHILNMYDKLLNVIHAKMPQADVYVSSIFKR